MRFSNPINKHFCKAVQRMLPHSLEGICQANISLFDSNVRPPISMSARRQSVHFCIEIFSISVETVNLTLS